MASVPSLLPPASTALERAIEQTQAARFDHAACVQTLWNAATCPAVLLPHLAWALSVDEWSNGWSIEKKRAVIAEARYIHQHKGTPSAIRRALASIGHPDAQLIERSDSIKRNGVFHHDGSHHRKGRVGWASYRVILNRPVTIDQAQQIKRLLAAVQRNCVHLGAIDFRRAALRRNGMATRSGIYTRGVVADQLT